MKKQLIFIDDSGDPGFKEGVSSPTFVLAAALFIDIEEATELNKAISNYRKFLGWKDEHEFKFRKASRKIKLHFLEIANKYHFDIYAVRVFLNFLMTKNFTIGPLKNSLALCHFTRRALKRMVNMARNINSA